VEERPVAIERSMGPGTIVLLTDSYLLSNEALHGPDRAPKFLSWLIGSNRKVLFDESHLGLREEPEVSTLIRKYRLYGLMAALAAWAGLYLWQQGVRFVPRPEEVEAEEPPVAGRGAQEGLQSLLRRSVPPAQLMETCLAEWRPTATEAERARVEGAWASLEENHRHPVLAYRALCEAFRRRRL
jgi:hypothetical protein